MTYATLDDVEQAMWAALATLVPGYVVSDATPTAPQIDATSALTTQRPVRTLRRYAGEVTRATIESIEKGLGPLDIKSLPAVLWAFEGARPVGVDGAFAETMDGEVDTRVQSMWRAYVVLFDVRGDAAAVSSEVALQPAALAIANRLMARLAGLVIAGAGPRSVRWLETGPWLISRRVYVAAVRFAAQAPLDADPAADDPAATPLEGIDGDALLTPPAPLEPPAPEAQYFDPFRTDTTP